MRALFIFGVFTFLIACNSTDSVNEQNSKKAEPLGLTISKSSFGVSPDGAASLYTLKNKNGLTVKLTDYGGIITSLLIPNKNGQMDDVVLGYDSLGGYLDKSPYFGAFIGRYGNRIAKGKFKIDENEYTLATNNGPNSLHGGVKGFDKKLWNSKPIKENNTVGVELSGVSKDMEEGYPGNLTITVRYLLNNDNELIIEYEALTDQTTPINLTHHSYFNLKGAGNGDILDHQLMIAADKFTPVDETLIPTGELRPVVNTPFDFQKPRAIGQLVNQKDNQQLEYGLGYDHNFVLTDQSNRMKLAATVYESTSGRFMEVRTTEPAIQFYCGNFLDGSIIGKGGKPYNFRNGFCLETQHFPDSPNQPDFPSTLLKPGEKYETKTIYRFAVKSE